jgi:hypothetical protein
VFDFLNSPEEEGRYESKRFHRGLTQVAHTCNPSYSGGRDQEDGGLKPARANSSRDPMLKKPITEKRPVEWLKG